LPDDRFPRGPVNQHFRPPHDRRLQSGGRGGGVNVDYGPGGPRGPSRDSHSIIYKQNVEREMLALLDYV